MKSQFCKAKTEAALAPLIRFARERGGVPEITRRLIAITGERWSVNQVEQWVTSRTGARVEPRLGVGLALMEIAAEIERFNVAKGCPEIAPECPRKRQGTSGGTK